MIYTYIFVGMGPANIFAVHELLEKEKKCNILMIDKGNPPDKRIEIENLHGFGGAGTYSDFKCIFNYYDDVLTNYISQDERTEYYNKIKEIIKKYHPNPKKINITTPKEIQGKWDNVGLIQSECWHIGSKYGKQLLENIYNDFKNKGVTFMFNTEVTDIDFNKKILSINPSFKIENLKYNKLFLAVGKSSVNLIEKLISKNNSQLKSSSINIGGRFECNYNNEIKDLSNIQYDFKIMKNYDKNINIRTFCVNHMTAYVVEENHDEFIGFNGHAYGFDYIEKQNNLSNFAILSEIKNIDVNSFNYKFIKEFKHPKIVRGPNFHKKQTSLIDPKIKIIGKDDMIDKFNKLHPNLGKYINDFIYYIDELFNLNGVWDFYIPEIKFNKGTVDVDNNFSLQTIPNVFWVGDSCLATNSIIRAAVSGMKSIDNIIKGEK